MHPFPYCSMNSRANGDEPIGSAGNHQRYLFVEVPLPWTDQVQDSPRFPAGLRDLLKTCATEGPPFRFQAFCSDNRPSPDGYTRVFVFIRSDLSSHYDKHEYIVPHHELLPLIETILQRPVSLSIWDPYLQPDCDIREIFICTHGTHDQCCGKFGYPIYQQFENTHGASSTIRAWRTSHIGGHRYAPTLIDFPEGRYWAWMTTEILDHLVIRSMPPAHLLPYYRGWGRLNAYEQVAERELFGRYGWEWLQYAVESSCEPIDDTSALVRIHYTAPDQITTGTYEAVVYVAGTIVTGGCGSDNVQSKRYGLRPPTYAPAVTG